MKRQIIPLLLVLCVLAGCAAPSRAGNGVWSVPEGLKAESGDPVTYVLLRMQKSGEYDKLINVWTDDNGVGVRYQADAHKEGVFEDAALSAIAAALESAGMESFDGAQETDQEDGSAQMYVEFASGKRWQADYIRLVPEDFAAAFDGIAAFFEELTAEMPDYETTFRLDGDVDAALMEEIRAIYSGTVSFNELAVCGVGGESAARLALSDDSAVLAAAVCTPEMDTDPYELQIVRLSPGGDPKAVAADFETHIDWGKWVCTAPGTGWIGIRDDMVLCVLGDANATDTAENAMAKGWEEYAKLKNR